MTEAPTYTPGRFVWRELMTPDVEAARSFYCELFGWEIEDVDMGEMLYPTIKVDGRAVGGFIEMGEGDGDHPPHWMSYVSVEDVDAAAVAAEAAGGKIGVPPTDIAPVGRFAVLGDQGGAWITAFRSSDGDPVPVERPGLGDFCWETVSGPDLDALRSFYTKVFGWRVSAGPAGPDSVFAVGEVAIADFQPSERMPPAWTTYVVVENVEHAAAATRSLGGTVLVEKLEVPGVGHIGLIADPHGALIGLFQAAEG